MAVTGGILYGLGVFLAGLHELALVAALTYGLIGGVGLGFRIHRSGGRAGEVVSRSPRLDHRNRGRAASEQARWSLAPIATSLIASVGVLKTFSYLGLAYLVVTPAAGLFMRIRPKAGGRRMDTRAGSRPQSERLTRFCAQRSRAHRASGGRCG